LEKKFFVRRGQELLSAALNRAWPVQGGADLDELKRHLDPAPINPKAKARATGK
jgi:hypothetical protein